MRGTRTHGATCTNRCRVGFWCGYARPSGDAAFGAEDLLAQTWMVAATSIADCSGDRDDFAGWLFGIARNHARSARRRTIRRGTSPSEHSDLEPLAASRGGGPDPVTDSVADHVAAAAWVRQLLAGLPQREQEVLTCTEVAGLSNDQTAAALGISSTAVRVARHRGLRRLQRTVSPDRLSPSA